MKFKVGDVVRDTYTGDIYTIIAINEDPTWPWPYFFRMAVGGKFWSTLERCELYSSYQQRQEAKSLLGIKNE